MADALSRKSHVTLTSIAVHKWSMLESLSEFDFASQEVEDQLLLGNFVAQPVLFERVRELQQHDDISI